MHVRQRAGLTAVAAAALGAGALAGAVLLADEPQLPAVDALLTVLVGWAFVGAGLALRGRQPGNRVGTLSVATGFAWFLANWGLDGWPLLLTASELLGGLFVALLVHLLVAFPTGRVEGRFARGIVAAAYLAAVPVQMVAVLTEDGGVLAAARVEALAVGLQLTAGLLTAALLVALLLHRWRSASPLARRAVAPVRWTGSVAVVAFLAAWLTDYVPMDAAFLRPVYWAFLLAFAAVPLSILAGLLHSRLAHAGVADLVVELGGGLAPGDLRDALARGLGDSTLALAYWVPEQRRYVDGEGRAVQLPGGGDAQVARVVERDGRPVAALVHDPALDADPGLLDAVVAAAGLALDNERLHAELRARLDDLAASRARVVEAADAERRRIERDLHDGAQQRLVSISMALGLASSRLASDPGAARDLLDEARGGVLAALEELRDLSQGIHPAVLTEGGLPVALAELAFAAALPVDVRCDLRDRLPAHVEAALYFAAAEALANVAKHAAAGAVRLEAFRNGGQAVLRVTDDGRGGADPARGSGLRGLADRLAALGGALDVRGAPGGGTVLKAEVPCAS